MKWWRHPIELIRGWWQGVDEPDWRTRLLKPYLQIGIDLAAPGNNDYSVMETWEYKWVRRGEVEAGWEAAGIHPVHDMKGRKAQLVRRRVR